MMLLCLESLEAVQDILRWRQVLDRTADLVLAVVSEPSHRQAIRPPAPFSRAECCHPEPGSQLQAPLLPATQPPSGFIRQYTTRGGFCNILSGTVTTDSHCAGSVVVLQLGLTRLHLTLMDDVPPRWLHAGIDLPESRWWRSASSSPPGIYCKFQLPRFRSWRFGVRRGLYMPASCSFYLKLYIGRYNIAHCLVRGHLWYPIMASG